MAHALQIIIGGLVQGSVFAVIALGLSLIYRVTGIINLAQGAFCILGALLAFSLEDAFGWPAPVALTAAVVLAAVPALARTSLRSRPPVRIPRRLGRSAELHRRRQILVRPVRGKLRVRDTFAGGVVTRGPAHRA